MFGAELRARVDKANANSAFSRLLVAVRDMNGTVILDREEQVQSTTNIESLDMLDTGFVEPARVR